MAFREGKVTETACWETHTPNGFVVVYWPSHGVKLEVRHPISRVSALLNVEEADDLIAAIRDAVQQVRELQQSGVSDTEAK